MQRTRLSDQPCCDSMLYPHHGQSVACGLLTGRPGPWVDQMQIPEQQDTYPAPARPSLMEAWQGGTTGPETTTTRRTARVQRGSALARIPLWLGGLQPARLASWRQTHATASVCGWMARVDRRGGPICCLTTRGGGVCANEAQLLPGFSSQKARHATLDQPTAPCNTKEEELQVTTAEPERNHRMTIDRWSRFGVPQSTRKTAMQILGSSVKCAV